jgi:hypothetical protein
MSEQSTKKLNLNKESLKTLKTKTDVRAGAAGVTDKCGHSRTGTVTC